ncbi:SNF5-domain-containing protein [Yamadazyma tenuis ATCC 10573]|uniref:SNF5-domain-containing protein n=2 Tax=Candida tenuis TaxID=2315449 RepID=G3BEU0_CANTC|nr:SNF5-domain-containing protein [Yamadazyma tenuis ATCC 10573]EGV60591.1 SNF5-domain-containing protein [Yamadazyma tenuis ATCC 10573]
MSRVSFKPMEKTTLWSDKLKQEGKEVPVDLKVYESMIQKDIKFRARNARQMELNKKMTEDLLHDARSYNEIKQLRMNAISLSQKGQFNNSIWGEGYQGYGNGITNVSTQLLLPDGRKLNKRVPESHKTERETNKELLDMLLKTPKRNLVPIRLDIGESENKFKLRDTFLWDLNEKDINIDQFVDVLLDDYKFIDRSVDSFIVKSIKDQIEDYNREPDKAMGELRIPIKINITVNNTQYTDQFEWDILNFEDNDPEEFSVVLCDEMNLPGEFATAISHSIREQTQMFHKSLNLAGYTFDGSPVNEDEIRNHLLPPLRLVSNEGGGFGPLVDDYFSILRNPTNVNDYTPSLIKLTQLEIERLDKEMERETRHKRRQNNELQSLSTGGRGTSRRAAYAPRGGPTLPDLSDIPKTFRTAQPSSVLPGGVDLGVPDIFAYNEVIVHKTNIPNPDYKAPQSKIHRVVFNHDENNGRFLVKIKLGPPPGVNPYQMAPGQYGAMGHLNQTRHR